ncbi:MAG: peptidoglycan DD-metalloendopeptidase family protein [Anaerolineaceae bacterium]|nr:peptidoglycan DD-metalloendopeptidase family protein [Anaerolineaceae bacterium]
MKIYKILILLLFITTSLSPSQVVSGQSEYPVYIVQPGDTINLIAIKFNVSATDIIAANNISDPNLLSVNTQLVIPGIQGVSGILSYKAVSIGENPDSLARIYQIPKDVIYRLNQTTSPSEFYIGSNVILVESPENSYQESSLSSGDTLFERSIQENVSFWETTMLNQVENPWAILPNETFILPNASNNDNQNNIEFIGLPLTQGKSAVINVNTLSQDLTGRVANLEMHFFPNNSQQSSIFGIHAMLPAGLYPFHLEYKNNLDQNVVIDQLILIQQGFYPQDPPLQVDPSTLDESLTKPEDDLIFQVTSPFTNEKLWSGVFSYPVDDPCIKSYFGNRRSYNDQPYNRFHTGVDFGTCATNLNIYAPADGKVVFTDSLLTRGNATIIDHGLGIYSGFWHQETILVEEGQFVKAGELIGIIGNTGRSTGPHLHWELIVYGVQVDPLPWLETIFP